MVNLGSGSCWNFDLRKSTPITTATSLPSIARATQIYHYREQLRWITNPREITTASTPFLPPQLRSKGGSKALPPKANS